MLRHSKKIARKARGGPAGAGYETKACLASARRSGTALLRPARGSGMALARSAHKSGMALMHKGAGPWLVAP